jgi:protein SCO1/2
MTPAALLVALTAAPWPAQVDVVEHLNQRVPLDVELTDADDRAVELLDLLDGRRPVVLVLGYYHCPMLCDVLLHGLAETVRATRLRAGADYLVLTVSIDPTDGWSEAGRKQATALAETAAPPGSWRFLVSCETEIARLAAAVGFGYVRDERTEGFAHPAVTLVLTPDGRISRYLYGLDVPARQLDLALVEAGEGRTGSFLDRVLLACYQFDPATRRYGVFVVGFLRVGAALVVAALVGLLAYLWRLERRQGRGP